MLDFVSALAGFSLVALFYTGSFMMIGCGLDYVASAWVKFKQCRSGSSSEEVSGDE